MNKIFRIEAPHFVAGGILNNNNFVIEAAPIIKYMIGYTISRLEWYCDKKNWKLEINNEC